MFKTCTNFFKNALIGFGLLTLISCSQKEVFTFKSTDLLIFEVDFGSTIHQIEVEIFSKSPDLIFQYRVMNVEGEKGTVTVKQLAMNKALEQDNFFDGKDKTLDTKTSIWLSSAAYQSIKSTDSVQLAFRQGFTFHNPTYILKGRTQLPIMVNGKVKNLPALYIEDIEGKGFKYWIWDNPSDPIVLKMNLGWDFKLTQLILN